MSSLATQERLSNKTELKQIISHLYHEYDLSLAESEVLAREFMDKLNTHRADTLLDGQIYYTAVAIKEPAGKPLRKCRKARIKLTIFTPEDLELPELIDRKRSLVHRLAWEAVNQEAALTIEDLAFLLHTSQASIKRYIEYYRKLGITVPTRGYCHDIGPGISHKSQVIILFLKGFQVTEIANRLAHSIYSVERYLDDFCVVWLGVKEGYSVERIARNTRISERITREYVKLIESYSEDPEYEQIFDNLARRLDYLLKKRGPKAGGGSQ